MMRWMYPPEIVYTTYIGTTPEELWRALTDGTITPRYWFGRRIESDWRVGGPLAFFDGAGTEPTDQGEILECDPPRRLSYSWHVEFDAEFQREGDSRVVFVIEPFGTCVRLTLTHDRLGASTRLHDALRRGWTAILSSLKTLLETGEPLPVPPEACQG